MVATNQNDVQRLSSELAAARQLLASVTQERDELRTRVEELADTAQKWLALGGALRSLVSGDVVVFANQAEAMAAFKELRAKVEEIDRRLAVLEGPPDGR